MMISITFLSLLAVVWFSAVYLLKTLNAAAIQEEGMYAPMGTSDIYGQARTPKPKDYRDSDGIMWFKRRRSSRTNSAAKLNGAENGLAVQS